MIMFKSFSFIAGISLAFLLVCGCGGSGSPDSHAKQFMQLLKDGKHLAVQEYLSKDMKQMATLMGGVSDKSLNKYYRTGQIVDFSITPIEKTDKAVRYSVEVTDKDGKTHKDSIDMVLEDGKWKVSRF